MSYPNTEHWQALADGEEIELFGKLFVLSVVDCGELVLPTGLLTVCARSA
jgi:hypothetical protein